MRYVLLLVLVMSVFTTYAQLKVARELPRFTKVELHDVDVYLSQGPVQSVEVELPEQLQPLVGLAVQDSTLRNTWDVAKALQMTGLLDGPTVKLYITCPRLTELDVAGANVYGRTTLTAGSFRLSAASGSTVTLRLNAQRLGTFINKKGGGSGECTVRLTGRVRRHTATVGSGGYLQGFELKTAGTRIKINGSGSADVSALEELYYQVASGGELRYQGRPASVQPEGRSEGTARAMN